MENPLNLKIYKLFQTCRSKHISDVSGDLFFFPKNRHHRQLIALFSPNPQINNNPKTFQKTTKKKPRYRKPKNRAVSSSISSTTDNYYYDWRSSDDEEYIDDETTLFSSRSFRSVSFRKNRAYRKSERKLKRTRRRGFNNRKEFGKVVKDSFAVAKKSSNPHEDFRVSMVEMIVEKKIFGAENLMDLFECFISLNSAEYHRVIFEVFTEILEALFSASD